MYTRSSGITDRKAFMPKTPSYEDCLRKELDENKSLDNGQRMAILERIAILEGKRLTLLTIRARARVPKVSAKLNPPRPAEVFDSAVKAEGSLGQQVGSLLEDLKNDKVSQETPPG